MVLEQRIKRTMQITDLPLLISYPRTGSHWMTTVIELYLNKPYFCPGDPRTRVTFLDRNRTDWGFSHEHDENCKTINLKSGKVLYLYREPVEVVFSLTMYKMYENVRNDAVYDNPDFHNNTATIFHIAHEYKNHLIKWLTSEYKSEAFIRYDLLRNKETRYEEFAKVLTFFDWHMNKDKMNDVFERVTKKAIGSDPHVYHQAMNDKIQSERYAEHRENFRLLYGEMIRDKVITKELFPFFK
jgi:hypothetical protein